ncbi:MAG: hypothetical protein KDB53_20365 [Planctomycetes bacterium]|nr:hypothetical protein [Planctomycetota bacterium]
MRRCLLLTVWLAVVGFGASCTNLLRLAFVGPAPVRAGGPFEVVVIGGGLGTSPRMTW